MKSLPIPFATSDFFSIPATVERGERGESVSRTSLNGDLRLRVVEYGPGYIADHWCDRGHVFFVLAGTIEIELLDGRTFSLEPNKSFVVSDNGDASHRVSTKSGGTAFIVD